MNKNLKKTALAAMLLAIALPGYAVKPANMVEANASFTVLSSKDPFTQEFWVTTVGKNYETARGKIYVSTLDKPFEKPLSINLYSWNRTDLSGPIEAKTTAGSLIASFSDKAYDKLDLEAGQVYRLVVTGQTKTDNVTFNVKGTYFTQITAVPEPETYLMWLAGLGLIGGVVRRRTSG